MKYYFVWCLILTFFVAWCNSSPYATYTNTQYGFQFEILSWWSVDPTTPPQDVLLEPQNNWLIASFGLRLENITPESDYVCGFLLVKKQSPFVQTLTWSTFATMIFSGSAYDVYENTTNPPAECLHVFSTFKHL